MISALKSWKLELHLVSGGPIILRSTPEFLIATWLKRREWEGADESLKSICLEKFLEGSRDYQPIMLASQEILENHGVWTGCPNSRDYKTIIGNFQIEYCRLPLEDFWDSLEAISFCRKFRQILLKQTVMSTDEKMGHDLPCGPIAGEISWGQSKGQTIQAPHCQILKKVIISKWPCKMGSAQSQTLRFCISTIQPWRRIDRLTQCTLANHYVFWVNDT